MSTKLFINALRCLFIQNRGGFIVRGGLTPPFSTNYYKKLNKMVETVIKAPNLIQGCTIVY